LCNKDCIHECGNSILTWWTPVAAGKAVGLGLEASVLVRIARLGTTILIAETSKSFALIKISIPSGPCNF
jgi:hypothetical protein